jgi:hypothetical protein
MWKKSVLDEFLRNPLRENNSGTVVPVLDLFIRRILQNQVLSQFNASTHSAWDICVESNSPGR